MIPFLSLRHVTSIEAFQIFQNISPYLACQSSKGPSNQTDLHPRCCEIFPVVSTSPHLRAVGQDDRVHGRRQPLPPVDPNKLLGRHVPCKPVTKHVRRCVGRPTSLTPKDEHARCTPRDCDGTTVVHYYPQNPPQQAITVAIHDHSIIDQQFIEASDSRASIPGLQYLQQNPME